MSFCEAPIGNKFGTSVDDQGLASAACSSTVTALATANSSAWKRSVEHGNSGRSDRELQGCPHSATTVRTAVDLGGHHFQDGQIWSSPIFSCRYLREILPAHGRPLAPRSWRLMCCWCNLWRAVPRATLTDPWQLSFSVSAARAQPASPGCSAPRMASKAP